MQIAYTAVEIQQVGVDWLVTTLTQIYYTGPIG